MFNSKHNVNEPFGRNNDLVAQSVNAASSHILHQIIKTQSLLAQAGFDLDEFMKTVVEEMLLLTPATGAVVELMDDDCLVYKAASGSVAPFINLRLKKTSSLSGLCVKDREIKIALDTSVDPRVDAEACKKVKAVSMVVVPLFNDLESVGVLKVVSNAPSAFSNDDVATLQLIATFLGAALGQQIELDRRKKLEQELGRRNEQLESVLAELERKNAQITDFTSTVSHELRTPLTSIKGALRLLLAGQAGELTEESSDLIGVAHTETNRLIRLVNDILDLGKIEAGKLELNLSNIAVSEVIALATNAVRGIIDERFTQLDIQIDVDQTIQCDSDRVVQILVNLLSNAIKFSPDKSRVSIKTTAVAPDAVRFEVIDYSCGISKEHVLKLFGKFEQLDSPNFSKSGGSGLGLAISKSIVEQHMGRIGVQSHPGQGSIFWFELPLGFSQPSSSKGLTVQ